MYADKVKQVMTSKPSTQETKSCDLNIYHVTSRFLHSTGICPKFPSIFFSCNKLSRISFLCCNILSKITNDPSASYSPNIQVRTVAPATHTGNEGGGGGGGNVWCALYNFLGFPNTTGII